MREVLVALVRMDIGTIVVGGGPVSSMVILHRRDADADASSAQLPIRIGVAEAGSIGMAVGKMEVPRPMTHDLLARTIAAFGAKVTGVSITDVEGTTFFAQINLMTSEGSHLALDARPSDAIALAIRTKAPIYADEHVLATAAYPDLAAVERDEERREVEEFHAFVNDLNPEDFAE